MAITFQSSSQSENISSSLGTDGGLSTAVISVTASIGWSGSITPKKRVGSGNGPFFNTSYIKDLNGVRDTVPITGSGIFVFDISQAELQLQHSMVTSGSIIVASGVVRNN